MDRATRESIDEPRIDGAEREVALLGPCSDLRRMLQHPLELRAREVGIEDETGTLPE